MTLSDSVSRYVIDLAEGFSQTDNRKVVIYTSGETKVNDYFLPGSVKVVNKMPPLDVDAIYHFHLTYSIRKHTEYLIKNIGVIAKKTVVTLHVTPEYGEIMGQRDQIEKILGTLSKYSVLVHTFSNYSKYDLKRYGITKVRVVYPGLNLSRYSRFLRYTRDKQKQILIVSSNPESSFVREVKGFNFIEQIKKRYKQYEVKQLINLPFEDYLIEMAKSEFYVALSRIEHYGFAIIDAYNLFTIPIYSNEGGLTEAVYGNGIPIFVNGSVVLPNKLDYNDRSARDNMAFSQAEHTLEKHLKNLRYLYSIL